MPGKLASGCGYHKKATGKTAVQLTAVAQQGLHPNQCGFRRGRSPEDAVNRALDVVHANNHERKGSCKGTSKCPEGETHPGHPCHFKSRN